MKKSEHSSSITKAHSFKHISVANFNAKAKFQKELTTSKNRPILTLTSNNPIHVGTFSYIVRSQS